jgi:hypothetical protein
MHNWSERLNQDRAAGRDPKIPVVFAMADKGYACKLMYDGSDVDFVKLHASPVALQAMTVAEVNDVCPVTLYPASSHFGTYAQFYRKPDSVTADKLEAKLDTFFATVCPLAKDPQKADRVYVPVLRMARGFEAGKRTSFIYIGKGQGGKRAQKYWKQEGGMKQLLAFAARPTVLTFVFRPCASLSRAATLPCASLSRAEHALLLAGRGSWTTPANHCGATQWACQPWLSHLLKVRNRF